MSRKEADLALIFSSVCDIVVDDRDTQADKRHRTVNLLRTCISLTLTHLRSDDKTSERLPALSVGTEGPFEIHNAG